MIAFKSYAQSGQDKFAYEVLGRKTDGTFLDVGAGHVTEKSNSYGLEQIGWRGLCIDLAPQGDVLKRGAFLPADATVISWGSLLLKFGLWPLIDYLSIDVDRATVNVLKRLPLDELKFNVITIEHDQYLVGDGPRAEMRDILKRAGYDLVCADVHDQGLAYEDWWCEPALKKQADHFRCEGKDWKDIFK